MIYLPNFTDSRVIEFCGAYGNNVDGFYNKLGSLGFTGSIDDRWKAFLTAKYGYFNGNAISGYESENDFVFGAGLGVNNVLLEDGTSNVLLEDGTSVLLMEA